MPKKAEDLWSEASQETHSDSLKPSTDKTLAMKPNRSYTDCIKEPVQCILLGRLLQHLCRITNIKMSECVRECVAFLRIRKSGGSHGIPGIPPTHTSRSISPLLLRLPLSLLSSWSIPSAFSNRHNGCIHGCPVPCCPSLQQGHRKTCCRYQQCPLGNLRHLLCRCIK